MRVDEDPSGPVTNSTVPAEVTHAETIRRLTRERDNAAASRDTFDRWYQEACVRAKGAEVAHGNALARIATLEAALEVIGETLDALHTCVVCECSLVEVEEVPPHCFDCSVDADEEKDHRGDWLRQADVLRAVIVSARARSLAVKPVGGS